MNRNTVAQPVTLESLGTSHRKLRLARPLKTGAGTFTARETILLNATVRLSDGSRHQGFGEAAPLTGWTGESLAGIQRLAGAIECPVAMRSVAELDQHLPRLAGSPVLRFGVELSILDALARAAGAPLAEVLIQARRAGSGPTRALDAVPVQFTLGAGPVDACVRELGIAAGAGYSHAKLKVGADDCSDDLDRINAIIERCPTLTLRLDANAAWTVDQALRMLASLPGDRVELIEQPVDDTDLPVLLDRYDGNGPRIAADESCAGLDRARALIRSGRLGAIVVKPSVVGGLLPAAAVFELALAHGVQVIVSNLMESAVARRAIAQLAAAWPELPGPHGLATGQWLAEDLSPERDRISHGKLNLDHLPGIGFRPAPVVAA